MSALFRRSPDVLLTEMGDGTGVLLHLGTKFYYTLNATGVAVWRALSGGASETVVASQIVARFRVDESTALRDAADVMRELAAEKLIDRAG
jgi:hypothetical protein